MSWDTITNLISFVVAGYVVYTANQAMQKSSGKTRDAISYLMIGVLVLGSLELLALIGYQPPEGSFWKPLFWDLDIITSVMVLMAVNALKKNK